MTMEEHTLYVLWWANPQKGHLEIAKGSRGKGRGWGEMLTALALEGKNDFSYK